MESISNDMTKLSELLSAKKGVNQCQHFYCLLKALGDNTIVECLAVLKNAVCDKRVSEKVNNQAFLKHLADGVIYDPSSLTRYLPHVFTSTHTYRLPLEQV